MRVARMSVIRTMKMIENMRIDGDNADDSSSTSDAYVDDGHWTVLYGTVVAHIYTQKYMHVQHDRQLLAIASYATMRLQPAGACSGL